MGKKATKKTAKKATAKQEYEFNIMVSLPDDSNEEAVMLDRLFEAGCDDAVVGLGTPGLVGVSFIRGGTDAEAVITEAIEQVMSALPEGSLLRNVGPDLVSLAEVAARLGVTRQALQKRKMPPPSLGGLYRASEILPVLERGTGKISKALESARSWFASSFAAQRINALTSLQQDYARAELTPDKALSRWSEYYQNVVNQESDHRKSILILTQHLIHDDMARELTSIKELPAKQTGFRLMPALLLETEAGADFHSAWSSAMQGDLLGKISRMATKDNDDEPPPSSKRVKKAQPSHA